jgi:single-stranded-DNA-specific exonuclease
MKTYNIKEISYKQSIKVLTRSLLYKYNGLSYDDVIKDIAPSEKQIYFNNLIRCYYKCLPEDITTSLLSIINEHQNIAIFGDYDVDGKMATVILKNTIQLLGKKVSHYIPNRIDEGYGLNNGLIDKAKADGCTLIITCDTGITAVREIEYAKKLGFSVIITDHHLQDGEELLPDADLIINPHITEFGYADICGAFVAFKVSIVLLVNILGLFTGINDELENMAKIFAGYAAIATVADMMPILNENRILVKVFLETVNQYRAEKKYFYSPVKLINSLLTKYDTDLIIDESTIGYVIAPAINSVGRMKGNVTEVVDDIISLNTYGKFLNDYLSLNFLRKNLTKEVLDKVNIIWKPIGFYLLKESDYSHSIEGILGLIANNLSNKTKGTVFVGIEKNGYYIFSGRSNSKYNLHEGFIRCKNKYKITGGGHAEACGIKIKIQDYDEVVEFFTDDYNIYFNEESKVDTVYHLDDTNLSDENFKLILENRPFGVGFNNILLYSKYTNIENYDRIYYKVTLENGSTIEAISFNTRLAENIKSSENNEIILQMTTNKNEPVFQIIDL